MIVVRLREMIRAYEKGSGEKLTYADLAARSGVARATIESLASRGGYNATLATIDKLCGALGCSLSELVEYRPSEEGEKGTKRPGSTKG